MDQAPKDLTVLLAEATKGDQQAASKLEPLVYDECYDWQGTTCVVSGRTTPFRPPPWFTAYLKLVQHQSVDWQNRAHFFGIANKYVTKRRRPRQPKR